ncbi:hypothetical protein D3C77_446940 [compost metagenome]
MKYPDDIIQPFFIDRKSGVTLRGYSIDDFNPCNTSMNRPHIDAMCHELRGCFIVKIKQIMDDCTFALLDRPSL